MASALRLYMRGSLLGARCAVIEWLCLFRHGCLISFYEQRLRTCDFNRISGVYITWRWDDEGSGSDKKGCGQPTAALPVGASHPFYQRLNQILDEKKFDEYVEGLCGSNPNSSYSTNGNSGAILDSACTRYR